MNFYFDTEFNGLTQHTELISMGIVNDEGDTFYVEFPWVEANDSWIEKNVIGNLKHKGSPYYAVVEINFIDKSSRVYELNQLSQVLDLLVNYLTDSNNKCQMISDCSSYDWVLFCELWGGALDIPNFISPYCHDINQDIARYLCETDEQAFNESRESLVNARGEKHNALYDAQVIKKIYEFIHK